jgi:hypothetical protein
MEQSPSWEANRFVASQEIPRVLLKPKVHYRIHKCMPPASSLSQLNPVHTPTAHFLKIHPNIILPSMSGSPQWPLSPPKPYTRLSPHPIRATCPTHPILLDFITRTISVLHIIFKTSYCVDISSCFTVSVSREIRTVSDIYDEYFAFLFMIPVSSDGRANGQSDLREGAS